MIIGLTGTKASGKSYVAQHLKSKDFKYISLSDFVREEARKKNPLPTAEDLKETGDGLRKKFGPAVLAKMVLEKMNGGNYVIDGIRNPAEVELLRKRLKDFYLLSVDADREIRYQRIISRGREDRPKSFEEFLKIDETDLGKGEPKEGHRVHDTMALADIKMINNGTIEEMHKRVDAILSKIK